MMNKIKLWWKTQVLGEVVFDSNGKPYDVKGLREDDNGNLYIDKKAYGSDYIYCGEGVYLHQPYMFDSRYDRLVADPLHPVKREQFKRQSDALKGLGLYKKNYKI